MCLSVRISRIDSAKGSHPELIASILIIPRKRKKGMGKSPSRSLILQTG